MRVAFLSFDFGEYSIRIASALAEKADVLLLLPDREANPYLAMLNGSVQTHFFVKPRLRQPLAQFRAVARLLSEIRRFKPDVVHLQSGHLWFNLALPLLRRYPLVLTVHDAERHVGDKDAQNTPQWILDFGSFRARKVIVHAPQVKEVLLRRLSIQNEDVHVIPHVLLGDEGQGRATEDEATVLFFGRIWEYKGLEYLIRAEPSISARVPAAKIVIAGAGENFDRYRRMMVNRERFIIFNEYLSGEKRADLFRRAAVVVLPYIEASQSGVIPLAYRFGKPVVATTVGGLPALVEDGRTGYLVPPRDEGALANAIVHLLQDRSLRQQFGAEGKRRINIDCAPEVIARKTLTVYREAVGRAGQLLENPC